MIAIPPSAIAPLGAQIIALPDGDSEMRQIQGPLTLEEEAAYEERLRRVGKVLARILASDILREVRRGEM